MSTTVANCLTYVDLVFSSPQKHSPKLRFGRTSEGTSFTQQSRLISFSPGAVFCLQRITIRDGNSIVSHIDIIRATSSGESYQKIPFVRPGGEVLLGANKAEGVGIIEDLILSIEQTGINPAEVSANYWRHVHNRLYVKMTPRCYTKVQHKAAQLSKRVTI
ncbi:MAG: DUF2840 domain-containing protein [Methylocystaceae bacterium]|nr:DUF2840 domain-containing protein [Methylocystaceae bacterium]